MNFETLKLVTSSMETLEIAASDIPPKVIFTYSGVQELGLVSSSGGIGSGVKTCSGIS